MDAASQVQITPPVVAPGGVAEVVCRLADVEDLLTARDAIVSLRDQLGEVVAVDTLSVSGGAAIGRILVPAWARDGAYEVGIGRADLPRLTETLVVLAPQTLERLQRVDEASADSDEAARLAADGKTSEAEELFGRASRTFAEAGWNQFAGDALLDLARLAKGDRSREARRAALASFNHAGREYRDAGNYADAGLYYRRAIELAQDLGELGEQAINESNLGEVLLYQRFNDPDKLRQARHFCEEALAHFTEWAMAPDRPRSEVVIRKNLSAVCVVQGKYGRAAGQYELAIARLEADKAPDEEIEELRLRLAGIVAAAERGEPASFATVIPAGRGDVTGGSIVLRMLRNVRTDLARVARDVSLIEAPPLLPAIELAPLELLQLLVRLFKHAVALSEPSATISLTVRYETERGAHGVAFGFTWPRHRAFTAKPRASEALELGRMSETKAAIERLHGTFVWTMEAEDVTMRVWLRAG